MSKNIRWQLVTYKCVDKPNTRTHDASLARSRIVLSYQRIRDGPNPRVFLGAYRDQNKEQKCQSEQDHKPAHAPDKAKMIADRYHSVHNKQHPAAAAPSRCWRTPTLSQITAQVAATICPLIFSADLPTYSSSANSRFSGTIFLVS